MNWTSIEDTLTDLRQGESLSLHGRIKEIRSHKHRKFVDLVDDTTHIQVVVERETCPELFHQLSDLGRGSYLQVSGILSQDSRGNPEVTADHFDVLASSDVNLATPWSFDGTDPSHGMKTFVMPEYYVANPQRAAVLKIKATFHAALHAYFQGDGFTPVEPPIITSKTLYGGGNAITAKVHGEDLFLSQCATFELEPLALALGKVYTISPAFRNEPYGSKRHLAEYTHAKAEALLYDTDDLKQLAGNSIYAAMVAVRDTHQRELALLGVDLDIEGLKPEHHEHISYNDALQLTQSKGSTTQWGEGLKRNDEMMLTDHFGGKYVWVNFPPFVSEGFPYRRLPEDPSLSMTCDLIAPHGAGEMVGVAEKITDPEELIVNLIEKGQKENINQYWDYIALRRAGMPPHGGIGAAPERILYGLLNLDHIRLTKPWPRYPERNITSPLNGSPKNYGSDVLQGLIEKYDL